MGKRKNKSLSLKQKIFYNILFLSLFAILIFSIVCFGDIFLLLHKLYNYIYVVPTTFSLVLSYILLATCIIVLLLLYKKVVIEKEGMKKVFLKYKKSLAFFLATLLISGMLSYFSFEYIEDSCYFNKLLYKYTEVFRGEDINHIDISVENFVSSPTGATVYNDYNLLIKLRSKKGEYVLDSSSFYRYSDLYNFLSGFDKEIISIDKNRLNELCEY